MSESSDRWRKLYNGFDPTARLELADRDLFVQRPGAVAESIAEDLNLDLEPEGKWVVCGSMGSGKSSELVHLHGILQADRVVIGLDLPRSVTRVDRIQPAEVLFLVGAAALRTAALWQHRIEPKLADELTSAFQGLLGDAKFSVRLGDVIEGVALLAANAVAAGAAAGVAKVLKAASPEKVQVSRSSPLGGLTRALREGEPDLERLREAVDAILAVVGNDRPPVVLVDGLDKISDRNAIRDLFATTRILSLPRAQIVYTAPITLMFGTDWQATGGAFRRVRLTNVAISRPPLDWVHVSDAQLAAGLDALRDVVRRRLSRLELEESDVFEEGVITKLSEASGGLLRDLIHLVNRAVRGVLRDGAARIAPTHASSAIEEIRKEYEITLNTRRVDELVHVRKSGEPSGADDVSTELLLSGYVLPYSNGGVWFEPHPILRGLRAGL